MGISLPVGENICGAAEMNVVQWDLLLSLLNELLLCIFFLLFKRKNSLSSTITLSARKNSRQVMCTAAEKSNF